MPPIFPLPMLISRGAVSQERGSWISSAWRAAASLTIPPKGCTRAGRGHWCGGGAAARAWLRNGSGGPRHPNTGLGFQSIHRDRRSPTRTAGWPVPATPQGPGGRQERTRRSRLLLRRNGDAPPRSHHANSRTRNRLAVLADLRLRAAGAPLAGGAVYCRRGCHQHAGRVGPRRAHRRST